MAHHNHQKKDSSFARIAGSTCAGLLELLIFHPIDTVAKRLMSNQQKRLASQSMAESSRHLSAVIFREASNKGLFTKWASLFPGLSFAFFYKVMQRVYKFGGQPFVRDALDKHYRSWFNSFGPKHGNILMEATAGSIIGVGEIVLLPLDVLKIKSQTNPETIRGRGTLDIFRKEGFKLYRGALWTAARNAPGSFALFGGSALTKEKIFHLQDNRKASFFQHFVASSVGATLSIVLVNPLDVVKTRIQNKPFDKPESGISIVSNIVREEGITAFMKGVTPKVLTVGPKLVFSFTVAQWLISRIDDFSANLLGKKKPLLAQ